MYSGFRPTRSLRRAGREGDEDRQDAGGGDRTECERRDVGEGSGDVVEQVGRGRVVGEGLDDAQGDDPEDAAPVVAPGWQERVLLGLAVRLASSNSGDS